MTIMKSNNISKYQDIVRYMRDSQGVVKIFGVSIFMAFVSILGLEKANAQTTTNLKLPAEKADWFRNAKFGLFLHWGLYSQLEGSYAGHTLPDTTLANGRSWYAEWTEKRLEVPHDEYRALEQSFNPTKYDADAWVKAAKDAGMRYLVITSKHHDGFALWPSAVGDYDISHTPYGRDLLKPLVDACKKYGLRYGFYYSHWQDWDYPGGAVPEWEKQVSDKKFEKYWQQKCLPQVRELIERYDPDLLWFDTWEGYNHITPARRDELIAMIRSLSSKCLINGRICFENPGEDIDFLEMMDNDYPESILQRPWQTPATMQKSWGYHAHDFNWKSSKQMLEYLVGNISKGGNYLLNIGPKADGTFPLPSLRRLTEMGAWTHTFAEAIYNTQPVKDIIALPQHVYLTCRDNGNDKTVYIFIADKMQKLSLPMHIKGICQNMETGQEIAYSSTSTGVELQLPANLFNDSSIVVLKCLRNNE